MIIEDEMLTKQLELKREVEDSIVSSELEFFFNNVLNTVADYIDDAVA